MSMTAQIEKEFAVVVLTEDGTIVDAHDGCKDSLGWSRENLAGQDIGALIPAHRGLLISGILQTSDLQTQVGDEPTFSMRILAQRMDQSSFPARLVVRRFGETDCWAAAFYHAAPLAPPEPGARSAPEKFVSRMQCTPLEETEESESSASCESASSEAPVDAEPPTVFTDEALQEPLLSEVPEPLSEEQPEAEKDQISFLAEFPPHPETDQIETAIEPAADPEQLAVEPADTPFEEDVTSNTPRDQDKKASPPPAITDSEDQPGERHLLEQRVASLTSQLGSLHSELRQHLEVQVRTEKKLNTFEEQLQETKKSLARATSDLAKHKAEAASGELESARNLNKILEEQLALHKSANQALQRTTAEAERQLTVINSELNQTRAALAQETAKRQDLERKLTGLDQDRSAQERKSKLEICRLEAALKAKELELRQLELAAASKPSENS